MKKHPTYEELVEKVKLLEKQSSELDRLRQESDIFRRFTEATSQGMGMADFAGTIIYVNPRLAGLHGPLAKTNRIGQSFFESYPPALKKKLAEEILPSVRSKGSWVGELCLVSKTGKQIPTIENFFVVPDEDGEPQYFGDIITDISEQKKIQNLLLESEERYRIITEQTGQMLYDCDMATGRIHWAGTTTLITGFPGEEYERFTYPDFKDRIHPTDLEHYERTIEKARQAQGKYNLEYRFKRKDGTYIHIEDQGLFIPGADRQSLKMLGAIKDITLRIEHEAALEQANTLLESKVRQRTLNLAQTNQELTREIERRRKVEKDLRESENRYRIVTNHAGDGIAVLQDSKLVFVNKALIALFELDQQAAIIGSPIDEILPDSLKTSFTDLSASLETGREKQKTIRNQITTKAGAVIWVEGIHTLIQWEGRPAVLATIRDVTDAVARELQTRKEANDLRRQNIKLASTMRDRYKFGDLIGKSRLMQDLYEQILSACDTDAGVVIYGESGTGKELVAKAIHEFSARAAKPFVPVNCGAIPEYLMESEFFGHRKGAFTGADRDKKGYLDHADGGTLFLDEVGEISLAVQVKLLRAMEGGGHTPLGSTRVNKSNFRIISATNCPLYSLVQKGKIREDFYYRTHIVPIYLPPLRERKEDIPLLVDHFVRHMGKKNSGNLITGGVMDSLMAYSWPGNVRELQNVLQRFLTVGRLEFASGWEGAYGHQEIEGNTTGPLGATSFKSIMEKHEKRIITQALEITKYNRSKTAALLDIPRRTLFNKMQKYGL